MRMTSFVFKFEMLQIQDLSTKSRENFSLLVAAFRQGCFQVELHNFG